MPLAKVLVSKSFHRAKFVFVASLLFRQSQVSEIGFKVFGQGFDNFKSGSSVRFVFSGKGFGLQGHFFSKRFGKFGSAFFTSAVLVLVKSGLQKIMARVKSSQKGVALVKVASLAKPAPAQQGVHLTLGILRHFQAFSYASAFFWLDGFAVPAPAQVTQTVRQNLAFFLF